MANVLAADLGVSVHVRLLEHRSDFDLFGAKTATGPLLVKVGRPERLEREAHNLRLAAAVVGDLAPALISFVVPGHGPAVLAMTCVFGSHVSPGRLPSAAWRRLSRGLFRLHAHTAAGPPVCVPLALDFITLGPSEDRRISLTDLRSVLALLAGDDPALGPASTLLDGLLAAVADNRSAFELCPRLVHADIWPENVVVNGHNCWLVDWARLKASDYALDLANLKLLLDWVWTPWLSQLVFEHSVRRYMVAFADPRLPARMAVYLPLVSLVHLVQYAEAGRQDPDNAAAMRACLATAQRDRAVWAQPSAARRTLYALSRPRPSEYADRPEYGRRWRFCRLTQAR